jgi:hypothetical protein
MSPLTWRFLLPLFVVVVSLLCLCCVFVVSLLCLVVSIGGSRGASFRVFNQKNGGSIRIISVRRIPTDSNKREQDLKIGKPLEFHTKKMQEKLGPINKNDEKEQGNDDDDSNTAITVKNLPTARDQLDDDLEEKKEQEKENVRNGLPAKAADPDATVPVPNVATGKDEKKDENGDQIPLVETVADLAESQPTAKDPPVAKRGRKLLMAGDDKDSARIADSALESIGE